MFLHNFNTMSERYVRGLVYVADGSDFLSTYELYGVVDMGNVIEKEKTCRAYYFSATIDIFNEMLKMNDHNIYRIENIGVSKRIKIVKIRET